MAAVANNPSFASKAGVPQSVGADFEAADKGLKFGKGSTTTRADLQKINKPKTLHGKESIMKKGGTTMATKGVNPFEKSKKDVEVKGKGKEGSKKEEAFDRMQMMGVKKMAAGGRGSAGGTGGDGGLNKPGGGKRGGSVKPTSIGMKKMAAGGFTKEANGVAKRGLTKGTQVKMARGGVARGR